MRTNLVRIALAAALVCTLVCTIVGTINAQTQSTAAQTPPTNAKKAAPPPKPKETFWEWALRFSGISANPNTLKGPGDEPPSGQVWMADLPSGTRRKITPDSGYRSPVYFPNGSDILALQGSYVVRISSGGDKPAKLYSVAGVTKLVGFSLGGPAEVLALMEDDAGHVSAARLTVSTGAITPLPYDPQLSRDRQMLEHLQDWQRSYGDTVVYVKRESRQALSGTVQVVNVFLKYPGRDPQNVSACDLASCGQPSLSPDGNRVLFVKANP
jgi:hypothetical protein